MSLLQAETITAADCLTPGQRTILCVDDEANILSALKRLLRPTGHRILSAESGHHALALLEAENVDLIISDMRMPEMSGAELLQQVRTRWPRTTRLLLTGYADMTSTIAAINEGQIHRYIAKPWNDRDILAIIQDAFERKSLEDDKRRLEALTARQNDELKSLNATLELKVDERTAELALANDRLKKNYFNSIKSFSNLIELRGGQLMGHARKVADVSRKIAQAMKLDDSDAHDVFIAALLHDIGQIGLSDQLLSKPVTRLTAEESQRYRLHPTMGEQALIGLDDMQSVASLIRSHHERFDGRGFPDGLNGEAIPLGARILAIAEMYEDLIAGHVVPDPLTPSEARVVIARGRGTQFDPNVTDAFLALFARPPSPRPHRLLKLTTNELKPGMVLGSDFLSDEGVLLLASDQVLTAELINRIRLLERRVNKQILLTIRPAPEVS